MAATTVTAVHNAFRDLAVTGVTNLLLPPASLTTAVLPCKWVDSLSVQSDRLRAKTITGHRVFRCRVVIAMSPRTQDTHSQQWTDTLAMVDTFKAALEGMTNPTNGLLRYTVTANPYLEDWGFGLTADIEAEEFVA